jgi:hypothetical protein
MSASSSESLRLPEWLCQQCTTILLVGFHLKVLWVPNPVPLPCCCRVSNSAPLIRNPGMAIVYSESPFNVPAVFKRLVESWGVHSIVVFLTVRQVHTRVAEGLLHCCFGRHTPLGRAHLCWVPDCVSILFQLLVLLSVLTHMRNLFSDLNVTGAAIVAAAAAVTLTLTVGLRLICTSRA